MDLQGMKKPGPTFNHVFFLGISCSNAISAGIQNYRMAA